MQDCRITILDKINGDAKVLSRDAVTAAAVGTPESAPPDAFPEAAPEADAEMALSAAGYMVAHVYSTYSAVLKFEFTTSSRASVQHSTRHQWPETKVTGFIMSSSCVQLCTSPSSVNRLG